MALLRKRVWKNVFALSLYAAVFVALWFGAGGGFPVLLALWLWAGPAILFRLAFAMETWPGIITVAVIAATLLYFAMEPAFSSEPSAFFGVLIVPVLGFLIFGAVAAAAYFLERWYLQGHQPR